ncbi:MAG: hypothetical protein FVQ81_03400 [Candidatus Glassbacteria bacterium]|nr:hypothetical protein [Candidatus Glassbacteria bacterium]
MKLTMMAMAANRLGDQQCPEVRWEIAVGVRLADGGSGKPEGDGYIVCIPAIAALEKMHSN